MSRRLIIFFFTILAFGMLVFLNIAGVPLFSVPIALAQDSSPTPQATPTVGLMSIDNRVCLDCHGQPGQVVKLGDGEELDLTIPAETYDASIHGKKGYACVQCHTTVGNYPHPPFEAKDGRDVTLQLNRACSRCHAHQSELAHDSVHAAAQAAGVRQAAVCTDCHGSHNVIQLTDPSTHKLRAEARPWVAQTCSQCHNAIYQEYKESVHGSALLQNGNPDVPTCIDCHGVHNIQNPTTNTFRLNSPLLCAKCHTDPQRMAKYGISTEVLNTYVSDFHGTTVTLFRNESPDAPTNKPVCIDCHGVHNIMRTDDPQKGLQVKENLLVRCRRCHPDANANFPTAWLSHYIPSPEKAPLVYYVNQFYVFLIPTVLGGMALLVVMDVSRSTLNKVRQKRQKPVQRPAHEAAPTEADTSQSVPASADQLEQPVISEPSIHQLPVEPAAPDKEAFVPPEPPSTPEMPTPEPTEPPAVPSQSDEGGEEVSND